jgi:hypothetical protein
MIDGRPAATWKPRTSGRNDSLRAAWGLMDTTDCFAWNAEEAVLSRHCLAHTSQFPHQSATAPPPLYAAVIAHTLFSS